MMTSHAWFDGAQTRIAFNCQSILIFSYIYIYTYSDFFIYIYSDTATDIV